MNRWGHCWQMEHFILFFLRNQNLCLRLGLISAVRADGGEGPLNYLCSVSNNYLKKSLTVKDRTKVLGDGSEGGPGKVCGCILFRGNC